MDSPLATDQPRISVSACRKLPLGSDNLLLHLASSLGSDFGQWLLRKFWLWFQPWIKGLTRTFISHPCQEAVPGCYGLSISPLLLLSLSLYLPVLCIFPRFSILFSVSSSFPSSEPLSGAIVGDKQPNWYCCTKISLRHLTKQLQMRIKTDWFVFALSL